MSSPTPEAFTPKPILVNIQAAATALGVSTRHVRRMISKGALKPRKLGPKCIRLAWAEVMALANGQTPSDVTSTV